MDLEILRHSCSHVMAQAVKELYPEAKLGIGPAIEAGFYYDFDLPVQLVPEDLTKIEAKMKEIIKADQKFERIEVSKEEAVRLMQERNENYKLQLIQSLTDERVSFYKNGSFLDFCRGPHLGSTGEIKDFKLLSVAGAYWRGIETNPVLQRIYGVAFASKKELDEHLKNLDEIKKRDHRKIGKELDLFSIHEEAGAGFVYYHPRGAVIKNIIEDFLRRENSKRGYELVSIPHIAKIDLYDTSGHTSYYRENMYFMKIDQQDYVIKPMNCPGHILIYKRKLNSYRDLPIRFFELGTVYRYEKSGVLHGLLRVRGFTQDDAHIFCRPDQLKEEIISVLEFIDYTMKKFEFNYEVNLSTRPEKFTGQAEDWDRAEKVLKEALEEKNIPFAVDPGAGVFYGPKIDVKLKDALGRLWQGPTVQVDFNLPQRFDLSYIDEDSSKQRPVMIHRAILGSIERFLGALIENYAGKFPLWLSPVQISILNVTKESKDYALKIEEVLKTKGLRVEADTKDETLQKKIREKELLKVPYMAIVGKIEQESGKISLRARGMKNLGTMEIEQLVEKLKQEEGLT
ncbi:MAG: threonine--tRNA ligase [Candidatus Omnitrophica bacterium]|nr:threonine--tRNA ligase [Candidatus Omnitrophota bacterium]MBU2251723.1 threonine--tRNA ligase [Candidatus Omnitrophota bacterium]MBU2473453.1 threonine--tRNA ligase [Candidatus Omnitrophota bacterium]